MHRTIDLLFKLLEWYRGKGKQNLPGTYPIRMVSVSEAMMFVFRVWKNLIPQAIDWLWGNEIFLNIGVYWRGKKQRDFDHKWVENAGHQVRDLISIF